MVIVNISGTGPRPRKLQVDQSRLQDLQEDLSDHESTWNALMGATKLAAGLVDDANTERMKEIESSAKAGMSTLSNAITDDSVNKATEAGMGEGIFTDLAFEPGDFEKKVDALFPKGDEFKWWEGKARKATELARSSVVATAKAEWEESAKLAFDNARLTRGVNVEVAENDARSDVVNKLLSSYPEFSSTLQTEEGRLRARAWLTEAVGQQVTSLQRNPSELARDPSQLDRILDQWKATGAGDYDIDMARRTAKESFKAFAATQGGQEQITAVLADLVSPTDVGSTADYESALEGLGISTEAVSSLKNSAYGQYVVGQIESGTPIAEALTALEKSHEYRPHQADLASFISIPQVSLDTPAEAVADLVKKYAVGGIVYVSDTQWSRVGTWFSLQTNADEWGRLNTPRIWTVNRSGLVQPWDGSSGGGSGGGTGSGDLSDGFKGGFFGTTGVTTFDEDQYTQGKNVRTALNSALAAEGIDVANMGPGRRQHLLELFTDGKFGRLDLTKNAEEINAAIKLGIAQSGIRPTKGAKGGGDFYFDPMNVNDSIPQEGLREIFGYEGDDKVPVFAAVTQVDGVRSYELRVSGGVKGEASLPAATRTISFGQMSGRLDSMRDRPVDAGPSGESYRAVREEQGAAERSVAPPATGEEAPPATGEEAPVTEEQGRIDKEFDEGVESGRALIFTEEADIVTATAASSFAMYRLNKNANRRLKATTGIGGGDLVEELLDHFSPNHSGRGRDGTYIVGGKKGNSQRVLNTVYKGLGIPKDQWVNISEWHDAPGKQKARFKKELKRLRRVHGDAAIKKVLKSELFDKGAKVAMQRIGRRIATAAPGGPWTWGLLAADLVVFGLSDDDTYAAMDGLQDRSGVTEAFDEINQYGFFEMSASFDYTPPPENAGYIGTALHYMGEWTMGVAGELSTGKGAAGLVRSIPRSLAFLTIEQPAAFGISLFELAGQQGTALVKGLATRGRNADFLPAWVDNNENFVNSMAASAVATGLIKDMNTGFAAFDGDQRGVLITQLRPIVSELRSIERQSTVITNPVVSRIIQDSIGFGGDLHERYVAGNESLMGVVDPEGERGGDMPRLHINGGVFWSNRAGSERFNPNAGHRLVGNSELGGVLDLLETVSSDQDNVRYSPSEVAAARAFLIDQTRDVPNAAHRLVNMVQDGFADRSLSKIESDEILGEWHRFTDLLPEGDPLEYADDWYENALASNKNIPAGTAEHFGDTLSEYLDWARSTGDPSLSLPSSDIEGLTSRQKLTIDLLSWIGSGAPTKRGPQRNRRLSDFFPTTPEDLVTSKSLLSATGIYIDPVSQTYGYRFELENDTPEFLIHLRDERIEPKNLAEWNTEYGLFASRLPRTVRSRAGDYARPTRQYLEENLGIDTRNVGRVDHIDPALTGPDQVGEIDEHRVRPYSKEEVVALSDKVLRHELAAMAESDDMWSSLKEMGIPKLPFKGRPHVLWDEGTARFMTSEEVAQAGAATRLSMEQGLGEDRFKGDGKPLDLPNTLSDLTQKQFEISLERDRLKMALDLGEITGTAWRIKDHRLVRQDGILERMVRKVQIHGLYLENIDRMPYSGMYTDSWEKHNAQLERLIGEIGD